MSEAGGEANDGVRNRKNPRENSSGGDVGLTPVDAPGNEETTEATTPNDALAAAAVDATASAAAATADDLDKNILVLIKEYSRTVFILLSAWLIGYFNFSATWLMVGLFVFMWRQQRRIHATFKDQIQQRAALMDEKTAISRVARVEDLPSWVYFPDVERAEWLNKIVKQLWPYIGEYVENLLQVSIEPMIQAMVKDYGLESFTFGKVCLGDVAPRIGGVKVYTENVKRDEIIMDIEVFYAGDAEVSVTLKKMGIPITAGLKNMKLHGTMRCEMKPLCKQIPLVGALTCFFLYNPTVDFDLTNLANLLDAPVLSATLHRIISDFIAQLMVLPNRFPIQLIETINTTLLNYPLPKGILRIHVVEANDLKKSDTFGKSDPYVNVKVGAQVRTTHVIKKELNPRWDEVFEYIVDEISGQLLEVVVYDKDDGDKDDFLGRYNLEVGELARLGFVDDWFVLDEIKKGKIHLRALWFNFSLDAAHIKKSPVLPTDCCDLKPDPLVECDFQASTNEVKSTEKLSCAFLMVHLDSAKNLPMGKKAKSDPSPKALLTIKGGGTTSGQESKVKYKTQDPRWEEGFKFLVHNPEIQDLVVSVVDTDDKDHVMGEYTFHVSELLKEEDMLMEARPFYITNNSTITMRLCLRILNAGALATDAPQVGDLTPEAEPVVVVEEEDHSSTLFTNVKPEAEDDAVIQPVASLTRQEALKELEDMAKEKPVEATPHPRKSPPPPRRPFPSSDAAPKPAAASAAASAAAASAASQPDDGMDDITREIGAADDLIKRNADDGGLGRGDDVDSVMTSNSISESISGISEVKNRLLISHGKETYDSDGEEDLGRIQLTLRHSARENQLIVVVHKCTHLIPCDKKGNTDPYVRLYLLPDRSKYGKKKTKTLDDTLNPTFDEQFTFDISLEEAEKRILDVSIKNDCSVFSREKKEIGKCFIRLNEFQLTQASTRWFDLCDPENAKS